jgi:PPOX class probable F420-dependent enzyme
VTPIWFVLDGDDVIFTTHESSVKGKTLLRDGRVALAVDDQEPPYSHVLLQGTVTVSRDLDDLVLWATKIGARYMGDDRAEEFGRRNGVEGELLVRLAPTKTIAVAGVSN